MGTYLLVLCVSLEQENAIQNMFSEKNWLFHKIGMLFRDVKFHSPARICE